MIIEKEPLTDLAETMTERRMLLQDMIDGAKSLPRIPRAVKLLIFDLSAELVEEVVEHAEVAMRVNRDLVKAYQTLQEEHSQLLMQNRVLVGEMVNRRLMLAATLH